VWRIAQELLMVDDGNNEEVVTRVGVRDFVQMHFKL
jgi:hypothetical protein